MSNFFRATKHPTTGKWERAEWLDNFYGPRNYGVRFPSTGNVYNPDDFKMEVNPAFGEEDKIREEVDKDADPFDPGHTMKKEGEGKCPECDQYFTNVVNHRQRKHGTQVKGKFSHSKKFLEETQAYKTRGMSKMESEHWDTIMGYEETKEHIRYLDAEWVFTLQGKEFERLVQMNSLYLLSVEGGDHPPAAVTDLIKFIIENRAKIERWLKDDKAQRND